MSSLQQVVLFALVAGGSVAHFLDAYYTSLLLTKGYKEANPINAWLIPKLGLPLTAFLEGVAFIGTALWISTISPIGSLVYAGGITALETWMAIRNKLALK